MLESQVTTTFLLTSYCRPTILMPIWHDAADPLAVTAKENAADDDGHGFSAIHASASHSDGPFSLLPSEASTPHARLSPPVGGPSPSPPLSVKYPFVEDRVGRILMVGWRESPCEWPDGRCSGGPARTRSYQYLPQVLRLPEVDLPRRRLFRGQLIDSIQAMPACSSWLHRHSVKEPWCSR